MVCLGRQIQSALITPLNAILMFLPSRQKLVCAISHYLNNLFENWYYATFIIYVIKTTFC